MRHIKEGRSALPLETTRLAQSAARSFGAGRLRTLRAVAHPGVAMEKDLLHWIDRYLQIGSGPSGSAASMLQNIETKPGSRVLGGEPPAISAADWRGCTGRQK